MSAAAAAGTRRGILHNNSRFMEIQEKYLAPNTSNNNSDAAPGAVSNINYMPWVLGNTGPVRGTRRLRGINRRHLSNKNKKKSNNIVRRRREKFLRTLRAQRHVHVRSQLPAVAAPAYVYENRRANNNVNEKEREERIRSYDPATWFTPGMGSNLSESREARYEAIRKREENEARAQKERENDLSRWG